MITFLVVVGSVLLWPLLFVVVCGGLLVAIFAVCVLPVLALMSPVGAALYLAGHAVRPRIASTSS